MLGRIGRALALAAFLLSALGCADDATPEADAGPSDMDAGDPDGGDVDGGMMDAGEMGMDAGPGFDAGTVEERDCEAYCACLEGACFDHDTYPYEDQAECRAACDDFTEVLLCRWSWCQEAESLDPRVRFHECAHATGSLMDIKCEGRMVIRDGGMRDAGMDAGPSDAGPPDAGPGEGGVMDATFDAGPDAGRTCLQYCTCQEMTCIAEVGYPFPTIEECMTICGAYSTRERECWTRQCGEAATNMFLRAHLCDHSWGTFMFSECP